MAEDEIIISPDKNTITCEKGTFTFVPNSPTVSSNCVLCDFLSSHPCIKAPCAPRFGRTDNQAGYFKQCLKLREYV